MKVIDTRQSWAREGMQLAKVEAKRPLTADEMTSYYPGLVKSDPAYRRLRRPYLMERVILMTPTGKILFIPITSDIILVPEKEPS